MGRRRFEMFHYRQILVRLRQGDTDREIARTRLMGRRKVGALRELAVARGWLDPKMPLPEDATLSALLGEARRASSTISTVEPYRAQVEKWVNESVNGAAIHAALRREHGYCGSYSSVQRMVTALGRSRPPDSTVRLHFAPADAAQVDFGAGPFLIHPATEKRHRTWAFVMTLCFSRHQYVEFVWDQTIATWLGCHRRAFEWFGRVPERLIIDNPKCAITKACLHNPVVQRSYAECAEGFGFKIDACPPADPQKKGIVEAGVKYVKGNFLPTRTFRDLADLNAQARHWVMHEAGVRKHGTTHEKPLDRFHIEQPLMAPLPAVAPDLGIWATAGLYRDCHLQFQLSFYSAPFSLIGQELWLRATDTMVTIYEDFRLVATHVRAREPRTWRTVRDHLPPDAQAFFRRDRDWCVQQGALIGPACAEFVDRLLSDRILVRLRSAQGILGFSERYGIARVEAACARALSYDSVQYRTIKNILTGKFDLKPVDVIELGSPYVEGARFVRSAESLFTPNAPTPRRRKGSSTPNQLPLPGTNP
jgi:transposase